MYPEECADHEVYRGLYQTSDSKAYTNNKNCKTHGASNNRITPPRHTVASAHFKHESVIGEVTGTDASKSEENDGDSKQPKVSKSEKSGIQSGKSGLE